MARAVAPEPNAVRDMSDDDQAPAKRRGVGNKIITAILRTFKNKKSVPTPVPALSLDQRQVQSASSSTLAAAEVLATGSSSELVSVKRTNSLLRRLSFRGKKSKAAVLPPQKIPPVLGCKEVTDHDDQGVAVITNDTDGSLAKHSTAVENGELELFHDKSPTTGITEFVGQALQYPLITDVMERNDRASADEHVKGSLKDAQGHGQVQITVSDPTTAAQVEKHMVEGDAKQEKLHCDETAPALNAPALTPPATSILDLLSFAEPVAIAPFELVAAPIQKMVPHIQALEVLPEPTADEPLAQAQSTPLRVLDETEWLFISSAYPLPVPDDAEWLDMALGAPLPVPDVTEWLYIASIQPLPATDELEWLNVMSALALPESDDEEIAFFADSKVTSLIAARDANSIDMAQVKVALARVQHALSMLSVEDSIVSVPNEYSAREGGRLRFSAWVQFNDRTSGPLNAVSLEDALSECEDESEDECEEEYEDEEDE